MTAIAPPHSLTEGILARVRSAGHRALETLVLLANANSLMREVEHLNGTTDEVLAARGTTRAAEVDRIFGARHY